MFCCCFFLNDWETFPTGSLREKFLMWAAGNLIIVPCSKKIKRAFWPLSDSVVPRDWENYYIIIQQACCLSSLKYLFILIIFVQFNDEADVCWVFLFQNIIRLPSPCCSFGVFGFVMSKTQAIRSNQFSLSHWYYKAASSLEHMSSLRLKAEIMIFVLKCLLSGE